MGAILFAIMLYQIKGQAVGVTIPLCTETLYFLADEEVGRWGVEPEVVLEVLVTCVLTNPDKRVALRVTGSTKALRGR